MSETTGVSGLADPAIALGADIPGWAGYTPAAGEAGVIEVVELNTMHSVASGFGHTSSFIGQQDCTYRILYEKTIGGVLTIERVDEVSAWTWTSELGENTGFGSARAELYVSGGTLKARVYNNPAYHAAGRSTFTVTRTIDDVLQTIPAEEQNGVSLSMTKTSYSTAPIITIEDSDITVAVNRVNETDGTIEIVVADSNGDHSVRVDVSAAKFAGTAWMNIMISRSGSSLMVYLDGELIDTFTSAPSAETAGNMRLMNGASGSIFDLRVKTSVISVKALQYYLSDLSENSGGSLLPSKTHTS